MKDYYSISILYELYNTINEEEVYLIEDVDDS